MPNNWEGIEDASAVASPVWLSRPLGSADDSLFRPLRKSDCRALNASPKAPVYVDGGRATADPVVGTIVDNFWPRGKPRQLVHAIWFVKKEENKVISLLPITNEKDSETIERLYQSAVQATSSLGQGIASVLTREEVLEDGETKIMVIKTGNTLTMKKIPKGWFSTQSELQRGYGEYVVPGEEIEMALGPVTHLAFVIHGIGEAMFSREEVKVSSMMDQMNVTRMEIQRKQVEEWRARCDAAQKAGRPMPSPPNRIELLPIEWFDKLRDSSSSLMTSLKAVTLTTIPALRTIANDVVFDVLMYMTPAFCEAVLECVTEQINDLYTKFNQVHPDFSKNGKCSLIGHSLGSVIAWDLLSILKDLKQPRPKQTEDDKSLNLSGVSIAHEDSVDVGYQMYVQQEHANKARNGTWGPTLTKYISQPIPFEPECTIFLGSPLGIFLTLRGAHPVFDEIRKAAVEEARKQASAGKNSLEEVVEVPACSPFTLPTACLYNLFHPSDPVAYRIEPLLLSQDATEEVIPPPMFLTAPGKDVRIHVKAKQLGEKISKSFLEQKSGWNSLLGSAAWVLSSEAEAAARKTQSGPQELKRGPLKFPLGGKSGRVDFSFQPGVIESEYISAVTAHSSYFQNGDFQDLLISLAAASDGSAESDLITAGTTSS